MKRLKHNKGFTLHLFTRNKQGKLIHLGKGEGFTLMEVIISVAVIITALVASIALLSFSISGISANKSKLIAASLVQEGLEIVRNIRDSNWFAGNTGPDDGTGTDWREGLGETLGSTFHTVQYDELTVLSGDPSLYINTNGFYTHNETSTVTSFERKIYIEYIDNNQIKVTCEVNWKERGRDRNITAETRLYNWYSATP